MLLVFDSQLASPCSRSDMRTGVFKSRAPERPARMVDRFRTIDKSDLDALESALRANYFRACPGGYLSTEWGRRDLADHLYARLEADRSEVIPWLDATRCLHGATVLEIGCGTGSSTVALAEQGARITAIDSDKGSLVVAGDRCRAYGLDVELIEANATQVGELLSNRHFDFVIFYASLEHMTIAERISAMSSTWSMLVPGDLWCVVETPNRLWYYDAHTSLLPFYMWLPDELAFAYSRFSPRQDFRELYRESSSEAMLHFQRRGRGVSFHEFEVAMKSAQELKVLSSLSESRAKRGFWRRLIKRSSDEERYVASLRKLAPEIHEGFFQPFLYLIIEKD